MKLCHMPFRWCFDEVYRKKAITTQSISLIERSYQSLMTGTHSGDAVGRAARIYLRVAVTRGDFLFAQKTGTR